jgi:hypothetical protein
MLWYVVLPAGVFHDGEGQTKALGVSKRGGTHLGRWRETEFR